MRLTILRTPDLGELVLPAGAVVDLPPVLAEPLIDEGRAVVTPGAAITHGAPFTAGQAAGLQALVSRGGNLRRRGNVGTRVLSGRMGAFDNATPKTFRAIIALGQHFDRVRVIFANGSTSATYTVAGCNVRAVADPAAALPSATAVALPSSGVVPVAAAANRRSYLVSEWVSVSSVARTDGGTYPLLCVDAYVSTAASITILGNGGSDNFANWATRPNGRTWRMRHNDGDCVTTPASFVSTTDRIQSPIVGVQYAGRGRVLTAMGIGDSITDGRGTYIGEGWGVLACEALSDMNGTVVEWFGNGWAGIAPNVYEAYLEDACSAGLIPDIAFFPNGSPNIGSTYTTSGINLCRQALARLLAASREYQVTPIVWPFLPTNPAVKDLNATDQLRVALNQELRTYASRGIHIADMEPPIVGVTDGDGQVNMAVGTTTDGIHPNDTGNALMAAIALTALRDYVF